MLPTHTIKMAGMLTNNATGSAPFMIAPRKTPTNTITRPMSTTTRHRATPTPRLVTPVVRAARRPSALGGGARSSTSRAPEPRPPSEPGPLPPPVPLPPEGPVHIGDIILSYQTLDREAKEQGKFFRDHFIHIVVHGTLHLLGYDHITEDEANIMESTEIRILEKMNIQNPYTETNFVT